MNFPERLSSLMKEKGLSNLKLSKKIGVSDRLIGAWKKGENGPTLSNAVTIADFFDISLDYLAGRSELRNAETEKAPVLEISENGREMLKLFEQLPEREQIKLIGRLEEKVESITQADQIDMRNSSEIKFKHEAVKKNTESTAVG